MPLVLKIGSVLVNTCPLNSFHGDCEIHSDEMLRQKFLESVEYAKTSRHILLVVVVVVEFVGDKQRDLVAQADQIIPYF